MTMLKRDRKAAIELSMNFLVIMIIGIAVLGMGIFLVVQMVDQSEDQVKAIDKRYIDEMWALADPGTAVVAPLSSQEINRGEGAEFAVGVRNFEYESNFELVVTASKQGGEESSCDPSSWFADPAKVAVMTRPVRSIKENGEDKYLFIIKAPKNAKACTYMFTAKVMRCPEETPACESPRDGGNQYGTSKLLYLTVR